MIRRVAHAWKAKTEAQYVFDKSTPRIVMTASQLQCSDGRFENIFHDSTVVTCFNAVPTGALARQSHAIFCHLLLTTGIDLLHAPAYAEHARTLCLRWDAVCAYTIF